MGKINLVAELISDDENLNINTTGIKSNNRIVYKENDISVTILIHDNKIEMNRSCNEYKISLVFEKNKNTISKYQLFGSNKVFDLGTLTKKLDISDNEINLEYELEGNSFKYKLEMEDL